MYVIGTAGHVDHGKSTLVRTLTGIDPDRLEEEQRREMTIDLGFAWLTLPSGRSVSIVDVPGHERFIKNMLAGVGGIDAALLVIAADESVMPQTDEHLAILDLLEISHGLVVLTKADLVDDEWLALVRDDVRQRLRGTALADAPIVAVSARSGQGLDDLRRAIDGQLDRLPPRGGARGAPRLSIDRAFTIGGFGTVVTGTLVDGPLRVGDEVELLPSGLRGRVRGLQSHQRRLDEALPGTRVAVNLAGVAHHAVARGDVLTLPGRHRPTSVLDARLRVLPDAPHPLAQNDRLDLFVGAAESACRVTLLDRDELPPGQQGWAQLRLDRPVVVARGDRYIVRQASPSRTVGGGRIVAAHPPRHRRFRAEVIAALEALARGTPADLLRSALSGGQILPWGELPRATGLSDELLREGLAELLAGDEVELPGVAAELVAAWQADPPSLAGDERAAGALAGGQLISAAGWEALAARLTTALHEYHRRFPLRSGMPREELRSRLRLTGQALDAAVAHAATRGLVSAQGALVRQPTHQPTPTAAQQQAIRRLLGAFAATPYGPPAPEIEPELLAYLVEQGTLVRVDGDVLFLSETYAEMVGWVREQIAAAGSVTVGQFRDRFGSSRKYALALLEHLDERKVTRRVGDTRVLY